MRVAIVQETVDVRRGGAETSTVEMARALAGLGLDVAVVHSGTSEAAFVQDNVTFLPLAVRGLTRVGRTYRFIQGVHRLCRAERFDIVHAITPCLAANVYQPRGGTYAETVRLDRVALDREYFYALHARQTLDELVQVVRRELAAP